MFRNALILTLLFFLPSLVFSGGVAQEVFFFPQIADGTAGALTLQTEFIFVNTGGDTTVTVEFLDGSGNPLVLELGSLGSDSRFDIPLRTGESTSQKTPGTGAIAVGYARVTAGTGVGGTAVFTTSDTVSGIVQSEAGVAASSTLNSFSLFVDSLGNTNTGLALVRPPAVENGVLTNTVTEFILNLGLYDTEFNQIATTQVPMDKGQQLPKFVNEFFAGEPAEMALEMQGSLTVSVNDGQTVSAVTLRQNAPAEPFPAGVSTLTTFSVVPGVADGGVLLASLSRVGNGEILVSVEPPSDRTVVGAMYRVFSDNAQLGEFVRSVEGTGPINELLPLAGSVEGVSQVEVRLIFSNGETSQPMTVTP